MVLMSWENPSDSSEEEVEEEVCCWMKAELMFPPPPLATSSLPKLLLKSTQKLPFSHHRSMEVEEAEGVARRSSSRAKGRRRRMGELEVSRMDRFRRTSSRKRRKRGRSNRGR